MTADEFACRAQAAATRALRHASSRWVKPPGMRHRCILLTGYAGMMGRGYWSGVQSC